MPERTINKKPVRLSVSCVLRKRISRSVKRKKKREQREEEGGKKKMSRKRTIQGKSVKNKTRDKGCLSGESKTGQTSVFTTQWGGGQGEGKETGPGLSVKSDCFVKRKKKYIVEKNQATTESELVVVASHSKGRFERGGRDDDMLAKARQARPS